MKIFFIVCVLTICNLNECIRRGQLSTIDNFRIELLEKQNQLWTYLKNTKASKTSIHLRLLRTYHNITQTINQNFTIDDPLWFEECNNSGFWSGISFELRSVNEVYENIGLTHWNIRSRQKLEKSVKIWQDLSEYFWLTKIKSSVAKLNGLVKSDRFINSLQKITGIYTCNTQLSPQQIIFNLYKTITLTELKGYIFLQYSYMVLTLYDSENYTLEAQATTSIFKNYTTTLINTIKSSVSTVSNQLWISDPTKHISDVTYIQLSNFMQAIVLNEDVLDGRHECFGSCKDFNYIEHHKCEYDLRKCTRGKYCTGTVVNCQVIDSDLNICPSNDKSRRYDYIESRKGILGLEQTCKKQPWRASEWKWWLFWECSRCICICDDGKQEGTKSIRSFNLRAVFSDIKKNMVVTGLRFVKNNDIIHLQVQEGKLLPRANIDTATVHWIPVESYSILDKDVKRGQDFHSMDWENRAIDLVDLEADEGHLVTGVRFKVVGQHLSFEIYTSPFYYETGQLVLPQERSVWKDHSCEKPSQLENPLQLNLYEPDVPTRSESPSIPDSQHNQYIKFTNSDLKKDAAQSTVPFLDAQPVASRIPVPLVGAGVYHKGRPHFGGFIGLKIFTYDFSKHISNYNEDNL